MATSAFNKNYNFKLFIDNQFVDGENNVTSEIIAPRNGKPFGTIAVASERDVDRAIRSARSAFDDLVFQEGGWKDVKVRQAALKAMVAELGTRLEEFAQLESLDCGKPLRESRADMQFCCDFLNYCADEIPKAFETRNVKLNDENFTCELLREPVGVVGCITPWNFPLVQVISKIAPALAAGCAIILKPSPLASTSSVLFAELVKNAGVPSGFFQVITGGPPGEATGQFILDHPLLDKLSFTGSGPTGKKCLIASANHLRPTTLELGGKSAMIVFEDVDLDKTIEWVLLGIFLCSGQVCCATSRILVHESIFDSFVAKLKERASQVRCGDPLDENTQMGPIVSQPQFEKVKKFISNAVGGGCKLLIGGDSFPENLSSEIKTGYYVKPTIFYDVPLQSEVWTQEVFGPVLCVNKFSSERDAIAIANSTHYGLANAVMTRDQARCRRVAAALRSGVVWENASQPLFPQSPFGGQKSSGFGRELGESGLEEYIHSKTIVHTNHGYSWGWHNN